MAGKRDRRGEESFLFVSDRGKHIITELLTYPLVIRRSSSPEFITRGALML